MFELYAPELTWFSHARRYLFIYHLQSLLFSALLCFRFLGHLNRDWIGSSIRVDFFSVFICWLFTSFICSLYLLSV